MALRKASLARIGATTLGAGGLLAAGLVAGRLSGLLRELTIATRFGVSGQADLAIVLLTLPDLLSNLLISGGLSAAFVPRARALSDPAAGALFRTTLLCTLIAFGSLGLLLAIAPGLVLGGLAPGLSLHAFTGIALPIALVALSIPMTAAAGLTGAFLNARDRFLVVGLGTLIFNLAVIAGLLAPLGVSPLVALGGAILVGALIRLGSQAVLMPAQALTGQPRLVPLDRPYRRAFAFGVLASAFALAPPALVRAAASTVAPGFLATFNYSQKLVELPIGIIATALGTIALTRLSAAYAEKRLEDADAFLRNGLRLALVLSALVVCVGAFAADAAVRILYGRGAITEADLGRIAELTRIIFLGLPFVILSTVMSAALNAQNRTGQVLLATVLSFLLLLLLLVPGIALRSPNGLMAAMVASQIFLAGALARAINLPWHGQHAAVNRSVIAVLATALVPALAIIALVGALRPGSPWATIIASASAFAMGAFTAYRTALRRELLPGGRKDATDGSA